MSQPTARSRSTRIGALALFALVTAACSAAGGDSSSATPSSSEATSEVSADVFAVSADLWVKAASDGMTGGFGEILNSGSSDLVLLGAETPVADSAELHETVDGTMQPKEGGAVIPAGEILTLQPGGDHLMLLGLTQPLEPGAEVPFTLIFEGGVEVEVAAVVKDFTGANESYDPGSGGS